jgi:hypothetical protein
MDEFHWEDDTENAARQAIVPDENHNTKRCDGLEFGYVGGIA